MADITGTENDDVLTGTPLDDTINGLGGHDLIFGLDGVDTILGGAGDDRIEAGAGADGVLGGIGADYIDGGADGDFLFGEDGGDTILGGTGDDHIEAGAGIDGVLGGTGADHIDGGADGDFLFGEDGNDTMLGGDGDDRIEAGAGADGLFGGAGADYIDGGIDGDVMFGDDGNDTLLGGDGNDAIHGGAGADALFGGAGADMFFFTAALGPANIDTLGDFTVGSERMVLGGEAGQPFAILASGNLLGDTFVIGAAALAANDYLIYNSVTGALFFDADGNGAGAAVQFATLQTGLALTAADFLVAGPVNNVPTVTSGGTASVAENTAASTVIYTATATDSDGDRITYSLSGVDAALLNINALTGEVRLNNPADFETKTSYSFNVLASDSGSSGVRSVVLTITDVADNPSTPIINEQAGPNNSRNNAQVIATNALVVATNPNLHNDDLPSATIVGSISDNEDIDFFSITLQAGELLILDVDGTNGLDSHLRLYAANGNEIGDNDDLISDDPGSDPPFGHNTDSQIRFRAATGGTYYFSIEAFQDDNTNPNDDTFGPYQLHVSIGPPATSAQIAQEDIEALISGLEWPTTEITYAFPNEVDDYQQPFGDPSDPETASFAPFSGFQQSAVMQMLSHISSLTALTFTQLFNDNEIGAKLRYAMTDATGAAHAYLPGNSDEAGSAWFNKTNFNTPIKGNYAWMGILHETGHALGLKHGHEFPVAISADRDSVEYSVMTYRSFPGQDISGGGGYTNEGFGFAQTLMMYDIAALQQMYGPNFSTNSGNTVYTWNQTTGEMSINGVGQGAPGANRIFMTLWDGGGTDTYDFSNYDNDVPGDLVLDLRPGEWTILGTPSQAPQTAFLGGGSHYARGNIANALMHQGNTASLIENAIGSDHQDMLIANQAANQLTGGTGIDEFRWTSAADAAVGAADTITDFFHVVDQPGERIHLSLVDANSNTAQDDAFTYLGTGAFTGVAGQLRWNQVGADVHLFADVNGDAVADMQIIVSNTTFLQQIDFSL